MVGEASAQRSAAEGAVGRARMAVGRAWRPMVVRHRGEGRTSAAADGSLRALLIEHLCRSSARGIH